MGRDNHNAGMHFVHHSSRVSDADAVAYISRKEAEIRQADKREKFADLMKYDNPCCFHIKDMTDRVHLPVAFIQPDENKKLVRKFKDWQEKSGKQDEYYQEIKGLL